MAASSSSAAAAAFAQDLDSDPAAHSELQRQLRENCDNLLANFSVLLTNAASIGPLESLNTGPHSAAFDDEKIAPRITASEVSSSAYGDLTAALSKQAFQQRVAANNLVLATQNLLNLVHELQLASVLFSPHPPQAAPMIPPPQPQTLDNIALAAALSSTSSTSLATGGAAMDISDHRDGAIDDHRD